MQNNPITDAETEIVTDTPNAKERPNASGDFNWRRPSTYPWIVFGVSGLVGLLLGFTYRATVIPPQAQFFATNLLSVLALIVIIVQAYVYFRQRDEMQRQREAMQGQLDVVKKQSRILLGTWQSVKRQARIMEQSLKQTEKTVAITQGQLAAMQTQGGHLKGQLQAMAETLALEQAKTDPRLRVSKIRIENFSAGKSPIFIVTIANGGLIDATGVQVHIGIAVGTDKEFNWIAPQTVIIPARWEESYPVNSGMLPDEKLIQSLTDGTVPIEVKVRLNYWPRGEVEFCFKYFPWPRGSDRPDDIPQFFDCDFRANVNVVVHLKGIEMKLTGNPVGFKIEKASPKDTEPNEETNGENEDKSKDDGENPN